MMRALKVKMEQSTVRRPHPNHRFLETVERYVLDEIDNNGNGLVDEE